MSYIAQYNGNTWTQVGARFNKQKHKHTTTNKPQHKHKQTTQNHKHTTQNHKHKQTRNNQTKTKKLSSTQLNAYVSAMAVDNLGSTLYVGGVFTSLNGVTCYLAAKISDNYAGCEKRMRKRRETEREKERKTEKEIENEATS